MTPASNSEARKRTAAAAPTVLVEIPVPIAVLAGDVLNHLDGLDTEDRVVVTTIATRIRAALEARITPQEGTHADP